MWIVAGVYLHRVGGWAVTYCEVSVRARGSEWYDAMQDSDGVCVWKGRAMWAGLGRVIAGR